MIYTINYTFEVEADSAEEAHEKGCRLNRAFCSNEFGIPYSGHCWSAEGDHEIWPDYESEENEVGDELNRKENEFISEDEFSLRQE